jgi:DNA topoisomerase-1
MPKKPEKSTAEKTVERYFPVDKEDVEFATEKEVSHKTPKKDLLKKSIEIPVQEIQPKEEILKGAVEKKYNKPIKKELESVEGTKKKRKKRAKKTTTKKVKYSIPKILLKKGGYELIITEKPQAAMKIATALGDVTQRTNNKISYYEVDRENKKIIVACAVGHLFTLKQKSPGSEVPIFDIEWVPNYLVRKRDFTKKYYDTILKVAKNAGELTVATDFDVEGEVIGLNVVRFLCGQKDAKRMKFSTLTKDELNQAYENKLPTLEWAQAIAGETRHYLDWFYGINLSRALMNSIKTTGKFRIMSIGRVQGPSLNMIVQREREILNFKSKPYWQVFIKIKQNKKQLELQHTKDIFKKPELKKFENLIGKIANTETKKTEQILPPHPPFNLTTLQTETYKFHGITPSKTLRAAQSLYLAGLISYPRTSSQKLPASLGYKKILKKLAKAYKVEHLITKNKPIEGPKSDPAHPSIYPTGNKKILSGDEDKIYNLIVKRFLSLFCDNAIIDKKRILAKVDNSISSEQKIKGGVVKGNLGSLSFSANGSQIREKAWMEIYPSKLKEVEVPDFEGEAEIIDSRIEAKQTQPPKRYSPASIISALEKKNLGTKATRSSILETLYNRGYIKNKSIEATPLGMSLITTMEKYSPIIIDEKLTKDFEDQMDSIRQSKKDFEKKEKKIINKAKGTITNIAKDFEKHEKKIGKELLEAQTELRAQQKVENTLMQCPKCKKGNLAITYSRKTRRHFIACDAYPDCKNTFSLPPNGTIKKANKVCEHCGFPMLMRLAAGRRPWIFCFNPECKSNEEWAKKREEKIKQEND